MHKTRDYDRLQGFSDELLKLAKKAELYKKPEDPKGDFTEVVKEVNYIYGGTDSYESREAEAHHPGGHGTRACHPKYPKWSKVPIIFN
jgi:hypothetical protein